MIVKQNVMIKGTKAGLTLHLDDMCAYDELLKELDEKLSATYRPQDEQQLISVRVQVGNRYLTEEQEAEIKALVRHKKNLVVEAIDSYVMTKADAYKLLEKTEVIPVAKVIRSGQVLNVAGDLLLIGDVNPGGTVKAGGNIYVLGALKGNVHAGCHGNEQAVIAATVFQPKQLKISEYIHDQLDELLDHEDEKMGCAYINDANKIEIDRLQVLTRVRPHLTSLKGEL